MTEQYLGASINSPKIVKIEDGDYQVTLDDSIVAASNVSSPSTITLPDTRVLPGWVVCVKAQSLAGGSITIQGLNGQLIDGVATFVLLMANDSVILQSIGDSWAVCGRVQVGGGAAESLAVTMGVGNSTPGGGVDLIMTAGDKITGTADIDIEALAGFNITLATSNYTGIYLNAVGAGVHNVGGYGFYADKDDGGFFGGIGAAGFFLDFRPPDNRARLQTTASSLAGARSGILVQPGRHFGVAGDGGDTDIRGGDITQAGNPGDAGDLSLSPGTTTGAGSDGSLNIHYSTWPAADGVGALVSDGAGTLSWGSVAAAPLPDVLAAGNQTGPVGSANLNIIGQPTARRLGGSLSIGDGTFNGGHIEGTGGHGLSGNFGGGEIAWLGGNAFAGGTGSGGGVTLRGGDGETSGGGGAIGIFAGDPGNIGDGAGVDIRASDGTAEPGSFGGPMEITAGSVPGGGTNVPGSVSLLRGFGGNQESNINVNGPFKLWSRTVVQVGAFTVAETAFHVGSFIYVSDESGGGQPAWSDATDWRRVSDGAVVS